MIKPAYELDESDLLDPSHEIIIIVMGSFQPDFFEKLLESSLFYIGAGTDVGSFSFWENLDEYDKQFYEAPFEGVQVRMIIGSIEMRYLTYHDYYYYLCRRINKYVKAWPIEKKKLYEAAEKLRVKYGIQESFLE